MSDADWYALAPKDVQSSSEDEKPSEKEKGMGWTLSDLRTPKQVEKRSTSSNSRAEDHPDSHPSEHSFDPSEAPQPEQPLRFDEEQDGPTSEAEGSGTSQERWQRTDAYMRDVQQAFRNRPAVRVQGNERFMKLLLVGEPGLGKELFVKNMFAAYCEDNDLPVNACPPEATPTSFLQGPSDFCTEIIVDVDAGRTKIHYLIQDTPGTHIPGVDTAIVRHIQKQNKDYMAKEEDPRRVVPLSTLPDPRVDAALFFLSPHYLKPQDVDLMAKLAKHVPVIPIIAKADALTTAELDEYRQQVRDKLQQASSRAGRPIIHAFTPEELKAAGAVREVPPFAIISSSEVDHEVGSHWFTRTFPWGKCEVMSSNHSDLPALKSLLFECCFEGLKAGTEARFYSARESFLTTRALSKALSSGELPADMRSPRNEVVATPSTPFGRAATRSSSGKAPLPRVSQRTPPKAPAVARRGGWSWSWGLTVTGVVALAIIAQWAAARHYSKANAQLEAALLQYQAEAASEKQVAMELREMLRDRQEQLMLEGSQAGRGGHSLFAQSALSGPLLLGRGLHTRATAGLAAAKDALGAIPHLTAGGARAVQGAGGALLSRTSTLLRSAAKEGQNAVAGAVAAHRTVAGVTVAAMRRNTPTRLFRPMASAWTRLSASISGAGADVGRAVRGNLWHAASRIPSGFRSVGAWRGSGRQTAARSIGRITTAASQLAGSVGHGLSLGWERGRAEAVLGGGRVWSEVVDAFGQANRAVASGWQSLSTAVGSGNGGPHKPSWARRLASAFAS